MIQYESIKKALGVDIAVSPEMAESIYRWQRMYRNKPPWISKDVKGWLITDRKSTRLNSSHW